MATILEFNNVLKNVTSSITNISETKFIENTSAISNHLTDNKFYKVFFHLNPSQVSINHTLGSYNSQLNYRIIVLDLLMDDNSNFEASINNTQLILENIIYKLLTDQNTVSDLITNQIFIIENNYQIQPFINEFDVKVCGWYVDIQIYKEINSNCVITDQNTYLVTENNDPLLTENNSYIIL